MRPISAMCSLLLLAGCAGAQPQPQANAQAQAGPGACAVVAEPWKAARPMAAAADATGAVQARFAPGEAVRLSLRADGEVAYVTLPQGEGEAQSFGGLASFRIEHGGLFSVGLGEPIWVDVVQDGIPVEAVRFGPGAPCSGIRKAVAFQLEPGEHVIELSGSTVPSVAVTITQASSAEAPSAGRDGD